MIETPANPLLRHWLAARPPVLGPAGAPSAAGGWICRECGLDAADGTLFRRDGANRTICEICALARTAAWVGGRVRLALLPDYPQGPLNALITRMTVNLLRDRRAAALAGNAPVADIDTLRQHRLLEAFQDRARQTREALPFTASAVLLRKTLRALPPEPRAAAAALTGLRYVPEPADTTVAAFYARLLQLDDEVRAVARSR